jgi:DNA mismatch endonuclease (patch repair protein)
MADVVSPGTRSKMMSGIRGQDTRPELIVRSVLHRAGFRFRLHVRDLPGRPDLVLPKYRAVVFVQGCFWHRHQCHLFKWPATRQAFWKAKLDANRERDLRDRNLLLKQGWRVMEIWECALKGKGRLDEQQLLTALAAWLQSAETSGQIRGTA